MKLSIVVCSYQQAKFLSATLKSLCDQRDVSPEEFEVLVIDGGSTDGSVDIIRQFAPRLTYWVSEPDRGQTHALIKGFARATGDIFGWLCSDDLLEPDAARFVLDYFKRDPSAQFIYGDTLWIDADDKFLSKRKEIPFNWYIWCNSHNYIPQPSAFWRRSLYEECGGLNESFDYAMDADLFVRFAARFPPHHVRRMLSQMRIYPATKSLRCRREQILEHEKAVLAAQSNKTSVVPKPLRWVVAKSIRVSWKLATGCYW